jgi:hypothetical protein
MFAHPLEVCSLERDASALRGGYVIYLVEEVHRDELQRFEKQLRQYQTGERRDDVDDVLDDVRDLLDRM